ncbi:MAG: tyrosine-protein phosphatase [Gammaproteobacteria bacterium]|nr:tyrosine-protein phosphatase [Gammaproteobacteria bacterium]
MSKKKVFWSAFAVLLAIFAIIQFVPSAPLLIPAQLPPEQRAAHRLLNFEGIANFRDLGGYANEQGQQVKWGVLYRSGTFAHSSKADLQGLQQLQLATLIDFRSGGEKEEEPNQLPQPASFTVVEIPTLDEGNKALVGEVMERVESGNFDGFDPDQFMLTANRQFATEFTPQFRQFIHTVLDAEGKPVAWHCSAGKDRTGFASAILLRVLGVPQETVMRDYMESKQHALEARKNQLLLLRVFKGEEAADKLAIMMGVEEAWLLAAFEEIDARWGSFDNYVSEGLQLTDRDIAKLRNQLLE